VLDERGPDHDWLVVMGAPAEPLVVDELESSDALVPVESSDDVVPVESSDDVVPVESSDDVVVAVVVVVDATVAFVCEPIEPVTPITPKAIAKVARAVATTRRRIACSRTARARSRAAAISRGVGGRSVMTSMVRGPPKDRLNATCDLPEFSRLDGRA
jgi:hypothetical protein